MSSKKKTKAPAKPPAAKPPQADKKRSYATATERVLNNLERARHSFSLVRDRLITWLGDVKEARHAEGLNSRLERLNALDKDVGTLHESFVGFFDSFTPPKPVKKVIFEVGDAVKIVKSHLHRYVRAYPAADMSDLKIHEITPDGDFLLTDAKKSSFMVPAKAHLAHRAE